MWKGHYALLVMMGVSVGERPIQAASLLPVVARAQQVEEGPYHVDGERTQIVFSVSCLGMSWYRGFLSGISGELWLDPAHPEKSHVSLKAPVSSIKTTTSEVSSMLMEKSWFAAETYPVAEFVSTQVSSSGPSLATISGNLTMHGVTHPVTLHAHFVGAGENPIDHSYDVGFEAQGTIQRSAFGMTSALPAVGDDVILTVSGVFEKER
ncbi:YceI family protein [Acetobacter senegalensis]|uniref:YceI family protein n=1 Tax=Acetobacter senegalensis TaxID=446692 RepID=UPI0026517E1B|nr:YceI family protein [Acetobacter senegalensis]MDN7353643.1 YceI family protein [Acetobacter senegalensis]